MTTTCSSLVRFCTKADTGTVGGGGGLPRQWTEILRAGGACWGAWGTGEGCGGVPGGGCSGVPGREGAWGGHEVNLMERHRGLGPQVRSL